MQKGLIVKVCGNAGNVRPGALAWCKTTVLCLRCARRPALTRRRARGALTLAIRSAPVAFPPLSLEFNLAANCVKEENALK